MQRQPRVLLVMMLRKILINEREEFALSSGFEGARQDPLAPQPSRLTARSSAVDMVSLSLSVPFLLQVGISDQVANCAFNAT